MGGRRFHLWVLTVARAVGVGVLLVTVRAPAQSAEALPPPPPPPPAPDAPSTARAEPPPAPAPPTTPTEPSRPPIGVMSYPPPGRHPAAGLVPVFVNVRAGERSFIVFGEGQRRIAECDSDCQFWAWPGTYRVQLRQSAHEEETSVTLRLRRPGSYTLQVGDQELRDAGLLLGVVGSVVAVIGTAMIFAGELSEECAYSDTGAGTCTLPSVVYYGLGTVAVGAGVSAGGFVLFGANHTGFHFNREPTLVPMMARVGPVPLPHGGLGLGATISF